MELELILRALAPTLVSAGWALLAIPFLLYAVARWRANRDPVADPQLGLKVALGFFAFAAFQLALLGGTMLVYTVLSSSDDKGRLYRESFGLLVPAGIVLGTHLALLRRTNQDQFPNAKRLLLGFNLVITGAVGFIGLVLAFNALFKRGSSGDDGRLAGAVTLVYGGAWAALGVHFGRLVLGGSMDSGSPGGPPAHVVPPSQAPVLPSQPQLPKLGGGSFPPIDPNPK
jgi:hypothetical protein